MYPISVLVVAFVVDRQGSGLGLKPTWYLIFEPEQKLFDVEETQSGAIAFYFPPAKDGSRVNQVDTAYLARMRSIGSSRRGGSRSIRASAAVASASRRRASRSQKIVAK